MRSPWHMGEIKPRESLLSEPTTFHRTWATLLRCWHGMGWAVLLVSRSALGDRLGRCCVNDCPTRRVYLGSSAARGLRSTNMTVSESRRTYLLKASIFSQGV